MSSTKRYSQCHLADVEEKKEGVAITTYCTECGEPCGDIHAESKRSAEEAQETLKKYKDPTTSKGTRKAQS